MNMNYIIPAFNEEKNIAGLVREIRQYSNDKIIVVDDASNDRTYGKIPDGSNIIKLRNQINSGKGYSVVKALYYCDGDYVCIIDGDARGIMRHINELIPRIQGCDCVIITPNIRGGGFGVFRSYAKHVVYKNTEQVVPWCISGIRILKRNVFEKIKNILDERFAFEVSMTIQLLTGGYNVKNYQMDFNHNVTGRDFKGFYHRIKQFVDLVKYDMKLRK